MNEYVVYFEIFGKKMKTTVSASNSIEAKQIIKNSITFHKVEDATFNKLKDLLGMK